ncbi:NAD(P)H-hydrate epimerase OS=Caldilinea aerophila (strain DSM 14535 / JCM 11387 / NBRC 104270 / STL-6-O1) GN=nnrE PE=3 SV=1: YjeF_N [Gemmataceae bacterium]|nr:NAD(P)H-hydrate epimerase OS=Caldilinea aerophila (strain DSM 14535 / JCM 11387 / NBRC 104270 / STL-6-O1) GN=nnrE PE=3 SV=1: YjeF_N [Gemmataceae bacterium]VTT98622.1 NAD(P)H-hydrate epimerase OS=Caldilinea aerophila (strain DSM 14535 / JCM 11387 / NBRC 104270 / STL-6-O1) GN=nnrE PE=3 SV=1: YjeF_N [Gemmataceae bacterium]
MSFPLSDTDVPSLTTAQMVEVDRLMVEEYGIDLTRMMESAGRSVAALARDRFLGRDPREKSVTVLAGPGGNGGGVLVAARRLANWGADVSVILASPNLTPVPAQQLGILRHMGVRVLGADAVADLASPVAVLDGLIGYSLRGAPRGPTADLIRWATDRSERVLALDVPSGMDAGTGAAFDPTVRAAATLTLALPKHGLREPAAAHWTGELYLADISVPPELYARLGLDVGPIFARSEIVRLT